MGTPPTTKTRTGGWTAASGSLETPTSSWPSTSSSTPSRARRWPTCASRTLATTFPPRRPLGTSSGAEWLGTCNLKSTFSFSSGDLYYVYVILYQQEKIPKKKYIYWEHK